jgi:hypothetical protein
VEYALGITKKNKQRSFQFRRLEGLLAKLLMTKQ